MFSAQRAWMAARRGRLAGTLGCVLVAGALILAGAACFATPEDTVRSIITGDPVLLEQIDPILDDPELTEEEKRQELQELGLAEHLIEILLRS